MLTAEVDRCAMALHQDGINPIDMPQARLARHLQLYCGVGVIDSLSVAGELQRQARAVLLSQQQNRDLL